MAQRTKGREAGPACGLRGRLWFEIITSGDKRGQQDNFLEVKKDRGDLEVALAWGRSHEKDLG